MNESLFEEKVSTLFFLSVLLGISFVVLIWLIVAPFFDYAMKISVSVRIALGVVLFLDVLVLLSFRVLKIKLTAENLIFGFGIFKKNILLKEIDRVEVGDYVFKNYFGYGIRFGRDHSQGFVPRGGKGVRIYLKNKAIFFFSSARAEELVSMIKARM
jgi:hypothetical protein